MRDGRLAVMIGDVTGHLPLTPVAIAAGRRLADRLPPVDERIEAMAKGLEDIAELPDPIGRSLGAWDRPNGLKIERVVLLEEGDKLEADHLPPEMLGRRNAAAPRAVNADGVDFIQIGQGIVFFGQIANCADRGNVTLHGIDRFKCDQFGSIGGGFAQQRFQMVQIIVAVNMLGGFSVTNAVDH